MPKLMLTLANSTRSRFDLRSLGEPNGAWPAEIKTATDWFCKKYPTAVKVFGSPFLEQELTNQIGSKSSTPLVPNIDCLAACLGGDERLGHRVIYYVSELQFYFYDPVDEQYHATTEQKLGDLLRGLLARCAAEVAGESHLLNIFHTFRSTPVIKTVVNRAKSLLEADASFFGVDSKFQRVQGPEIHQRLAIVYAEKLLSPDPNSILTVGQAYTLFNEFAVSRKQEPIKRANFKSLMAEVIRDAYGLGVRNDLVNAETQKQQCGWRGLRPSALS